jgi:acyl-homoserine-lactone acylase
MRAINPGIRTCLLRPWEAKTDFLELARRHHAKCMLLRLQDADAAQVKRLHDAGVMVVSEVIDHDSDWHDYLLRGDDALFTNDPRTLIEYLRNKPADDWQGLHALPTLPSVANPRVGWLHNTNDWPWSAAGADSPKAKDFPRYMDQVGGNARGEHADLLLTNKRGWTSERVRDAAYDPYLPAFARLLPGLVAAWRALPSSDPQRRALAEPIAILARWNHRWNADSIATSLAVFWGDQLWREVGSFAQAERVSVPDYIAVRVDAAAKLAALDAAVTRLTRDFGTWRTPWRAINRFQRLDDAIQPHFDDARASTQVPFTSAQWGSLASFGAKAWPSTRRYYGTSGNSFVAVVEFGPRVKASAVMAGGQSGDPASPHFADQIDRYATGRLRSVYFYPDELTGHVERRYRPGE